MCQYLLQRREQDTWTAVLTKALKIIGLPLNRFVFCWERVELMMDGGISAKVLVVDDDPDICDLIVQVVDGIGHFAQPAIEKNDILRQVEESWDCVIIDLTMPEIDGIEVLRLLAQQNCKYPIILISGFSCSILDSARRLGEVRGLEIVATLSKPIDISTLEHTVQQALLSKKSSAEPEYLDESPTLNLFDAGVDHGGVIPYYQPKIDLRSGCLAGFEALARWWHPQKGLLPPSVFIPQAIADDRIDELTMSMVECISKDISGWLMSGSTVPVALNIEASSLSDLELPSRIQEVLQKHDLSPDLFILEVTENGLCSHAANAMDNLVRFRVKGFRLSVDDFGTGHSTLTQLHNMPFNQLKIDKSFVDGIGISEPSEVIITSTIEMAHKLKLEVVAEGVETDKQIDFLRHHGCDQLQGYFFAKPMNVADIGIWRQCHADPIYSAA